MARPSLPFALACCWILSSGGAIAADAARPARAVDRGAVAAAHRSVARHAAEVARLKQSVAEQEALSRRADRQLQEQDRALERLRQELQASGASDGAVTAGP